MNSLPGDNSALLQAMLEIAHNDTTAGRRRLYDILLKSWFVVPTLEEVADQPGLHSLKQGQEFPLSFETDGDGLSVLPVFTDEEALRNWNRKLPWIALHGAGLFQAVADSPAEQIVINPFEPANPESKMIRPGGRVTRWELELLAQGKNPQDTVEAEDEADKAGQSSVLLATPKEMPAPAFFESLCAVAKLIPHVQAMYFSQVMDAQGGSRRGVAVEFVRGTSEEKIKLALEELSKKAREALLKSESLVVVSSSSPLGESIAKTGQKFYPRE